MHLAILGLFLGKHGKDFALQDGKNSQHSALVKPPQHGQKTEKGLGVSIFPIPAPRSQLGFDKHQERWKKTPGGFGAAAG